MAEYEWLIMLVGLVGLLGWELRRTRQAMRRAREEEGQTPPGPGPGA